MTSGVRGRGPLPAGRRAIKPGPWSRLPIDRPALLAAIDRRLWRDLGFADPEPDILRFLPMLVVAWADGAIAEKERETISERARDLPEHLNAWLTDRLRYPPGPYFRYQVGHLLAFLVSVWPTEQEWAEEGDQWADELIQEAGWLRRLFGRVEREKRDLAALRRIMDEEEILASDRLWAMARGTHAEYEPRHACAIIQDEGQLLQDIAITLDGPAEGLAVGTRLVIVRDEDLDEDKVAELLGRTGHLREPERWILLGEEVYARGRRPSARQLDDLDAELKAGLGHDFEAVSFAELAYLEDALAVDARWMSWQPGKVEALHIDREQVLRTQAPGTFSAPRSKVQASVAQQPVKGPAGLGFRVLSLTTEGAELRLASPVILREPATREAVEWIARFLPTMCDPCQTLVLDEDGPRWIAEVRSTLPSTDAAAPEPLLPGRSILVPPWVWFRAAGAMGVRFFAGKRRTVAP